MTISGVVKYKPSALFRNLCNSCMSVRALLLLMCALIRVGVDLGNSLDRREGENSYTNCRATENKATAHT